MSHIHVKPRVMLCLIRKSLALDDRPFPRLRESGCMLGRKIWHSPAPITWWRRFHQKFCRIHPESVVWGKFPQIKLPPPPHPPLHSTRRALVRWTISVRLKSNRQHWARNTSTNTCVHILSMTSKVSRPALVDYVTEIQSKSASEQNQSKGFNASSGLSLESWYFK